MRKQSASELGRLASVQAEAMNDSCSIYRIALVSGTYGNVNETRTLYLSGTPCGIQFTGGQVIQRGELTFVDYDVVLRLPDTVTIQVTDEIDLVEKGNFVVSGTFNVHSQPTVNSSVQHVNLKRQTP